MAYRLELDEPVPDGIRRIAREELEKAVGALTGGGDVDDAVHQARKRTKRVRACVRLVRDPLGEAYRLENAAARDASRALAAVRDHAVAADTFERVLTESVGVRREPYEDLQAELRRRHVEARTELTASDARADIAGALTAMAERVATWRLDDDGWDLLAPGFARVYQRGRDALDDAVDDGGPDAFHEWRKRTKYHRYQLQLLRAVWSTRVEAMVGSADQLGDLLGESHDLSELRRRLDDPTLPVTDGARETALSLVEHRRAGLDDEAIRLGRLVYAEKAKRLTRRLERYWDVVRA